MKTLVLTTATIFAATFIYAQDKLNPGDNLPQSKTELKNANGSNITLKDAAKENGLLVMFSCNTCPYVVRNQATTQATMEYAATHNVGMIVINSNEAKRSDDDSYDAMKLYAKEHNYNTPYVIDQNSALADAFGANHTPEIFLFDKAGKLVYKGAMNDNPATPADAKRKYINEAIDAMIAGKTPDPQTTKSIGCSIKRKA